MSSVVFKNVTKLFPFQTSEEKRAVINEASESKGKITNAQITSRGVLAVNDFNLEIEDREFIVLVGPSGCGKSTLLRMIAGLDDITSGELYIDGKLVNSLPPKKRDISMVFQNYSLYPHMSVYKNIAFPLKIRHVNKKEIDAKVKEVAEILGITEYLRRKPKALSGGQRQRVAIGRAMMRSPKVFLMDEPLSNLDAKLRGQMRIEIKKLSERLNTTFVYVTHDQIEAMTLGDRIVILKEGITQQVGTPSEVYNNPANLFTAGFIGTPQMNFFPDCKLSKSGGNNYVLSINNVDFNIALPEDNEKDYPCNVVAGIRPERLKISKTSGIPAVLQQADLLGSGYHLHFSTDNCTDIIVSISADEHNIIPQRDSKVFLVPDSDNIHLFDAETEKNILCK